MLTPSQALIEIAARDFVSIKLPERTTIMMRPLTTLKICTKMPKEVPTSERYSHEHNTRHVIEHYNLLRVIARNPINPMRTGVKKVRKQGSGKMSLPSRYNILGSCDVVPDRK